jgi:hypothetical protein
MSFYSNTNKSKESGTQLQGFSILNRAKLKLLHAKISGGTDDNILNLL